MTHKTTLKFIGWRHHFVTEKVGDGVLVAQSAAVAVALEQMIRDEEERAILLDGMADEVRARMQTSRDEYVDPAPGFAAARQTI